MPSQRRTELLLDQNVTFNQPAPADEQLPPYIDQLAWGYRCKICQQHPQQRLQVDQHVSSRRHQSMLVMLSLEKNQNFALANKKDITVDILNGPDRHSDASVYKFSAMRRYTLSLTIRVQNHHTMDRVQLDYCDFTKPGRRSFYKIVNRLNGVTYIPAESVLDVRIDVKVPNVGKFSKSVFFKFIDGSRETFYIIKHLCAVCSDDVTKELAPTEPYKPMPRATLHLKNLEIVRGMKVPRPIGDTLEMVRPLSGFRISPVFRSAVNHGLLKKSAHTDGNVQNEINRIRLALDTPLSFENYATRWSVLLRLEKLQADISVQTYNMSFAKLRVCRENKAFLVLDVPGLAENRPSLLKGDVLFVSIVQREGEENEESYREYEGHIHRVTRDSVWLGFNEKLMDKFKGILADVSWHVRFVVPEHVYRLFDRAVSMAADDPLLKSVLFPESAMPRPALMCALNAATRICNHDVSNNADQARAIRHIVSGTSRPAPYLIFGPPGTGKTVTLVEAILQILHAHPHSHILACTPSNSAADIITERLANFILSPGKNLYRIHARSRVWDSVPERVKVFSNYKNGDFYYPAKSTIQEFRVVVTTLSTAGRLVGAEFPEDHFTHIFVDECGQATEPECVVALAGILNYDTTKVPLGAQVVLAGDPKQLGPVIHSPFAEKFGFGVSLLERLMRDCELYQRQQIEDEDDPPYDATVMTELRHNYRSHPAILEVPNKEFYHGDLFYHADPMERELFCAWPELPMKNFPVIFHGTMGDELREGSSPSFFNPEEISIVLEYVEKIMDYRQPGLQYRDIGVITPYRKQVEKIRKFLVKRNPKLADIRVGTVEEFQGGEKKIIIVSTVRSNPNYGEFDTKFKLGFVANPKKFNVAITRAKALLIVVGNPFCLKHDRHWCSFIRYCQQNQALIGVDMDEIQADVDESAEEVLNDVVRRMLQMSIDLNQIRVDFADEDRYYKAPELTDDHIIVVANLDEFRHCSGEVLTDGSIVALDAEWTPTLLHGGEQKLALLQLAVNNNVYLLDIPALKRHLPPHEWTSFFTRLFSSEDITKVGFSIATDLSTLLTTFRELNASETTSIRDALHPNNIRRLCDLYVRSLELEKIPNFFLERDSLEKRIEPGCHDLSELVRKTLGKPLYKAPQISDWDTRPLLASQKHYAALDAHVLLKVYKYITGRLLIVNGQNVDLFKKLNNRFWNKLYGSKGRENCN